MLIFLFTTDCQLRTFISFYLEQLLLVNYFLYNNFKVKQLLHPNYAKGGIGTEEYKSVLSSIIHPHSPSGVNLAMGHHFRAHVLYKILYRNCPKRKLTIATFYRSLTQNSFCSHILQPSLFFFFLVIFSFLLKFLHLTQSGIL